MSRPTVIALDARNRADRIRAGLEELAPDIYNSGLSRDRKLTAIRQVRKSPAR